MVLLIGGPDSGDSITIENAYSDSRYRIEEVVLSDGTTLAPQISLYASTVIIMTFESWTPRGH
ncbi:hypothetical protein OH492_20440 [Vibrio chagasii]|nr:hypothetical protein [Vibrio chagasii]